MEINLTKNNSKAPETEKRARTAAVPDAVLSLVTEAWITDGGREPSFGVDWKLASHPTVSAITAVARRVYPAEAYRGDEDQLRPGTDAAATPGFAFAIGRVGAAVVVTLQGEFAGPAVTRLEHVLGDLIRGRGNLAVVVDLRGVTGIDGSALAVLSAVAGWAHQRGGIFWMQEPSPSVLSALAATKGAEALDLVGESP